jgi:hypothetical protein
MHNADADKNVTETMGSHSFCWRTALTRHRKIGTAYFIFAPQLGQNLVLAGASAPHFAHLTIACSAVPQFTQNLASATFELPHLGQVIVPCACACIGPPQLLQNFAVC